MIYFVAHITGSIVKDGTNLDFLQFEYPWNFEYKSKVRFDQNRGTVLRCLAGTQHRRHTSLCQSCRNHGHAHRSFCLLSDLTMKTTSYSRQAYHHISYVQIHTLGYQIKSFTFVKKTNSSSSMAGMHMSVNTVASVI